MNGDTLHNIAQWIGLAVTIGSLWRFVLKPLIDEREAVREWRRDMEVRMTLLETSQDPETAALRKRLTEE